MQSLKESEGIVVTVSDMITSEGMLGQQLKFPSRKSHVDNSAEVKPKQTRNSITARILIKLKDSNIIVSKDYNHVEI